MKIYLSGQITGLDWELCKKLFNEAEVFINNIGYEVVNPMKLNPKGATWTEAMKVDIIALLDCNAIAMLPNWGQSKGAKLELTIAREFGLKVFYLMRINNSLSIGLDCKDLLLNNIHNIMGVSLEMLQSDIVERNTADARKIYAKIARENFDMEWAKIGEVMNRDYTTAIAARKTANNLLISDKTFKRNFEQVFALTVTQ